MRRKKDFRAGFDTSPPESEVPMPGRWMRLSRDALRDHDRAQLDWLASFLRSYQVAAFRRPRTEE